MNERGGAWRAFHMSYSGYPLRNVASGVTSLFMLQREARDIIILLVGLAGGAMSSLGPAAFPETPRILWMILFFISAIIFLFGIALLMIDFLPYRKFTFQTMLYGYDRSEIILIVILIAMISTVLFAMFFG